MKAPRNAASPGVERTEMAGLSGGPRFEARLPAKLEPPVPPSSGLVSPSLASGSRARRPAAGTRRRNHSPPPRGLTPERKEPIHASGRGEDETSWPHAVDALATGSGGQDAISGRRRPEALSCPVGAIILERCPSTDRSVRRLANARHNVCLGVVGALDELFPDPWTSRPSEPSRQPAAECRYPRWTTDWMEA
jgi:hypothetical protein